MSDTLRCISLLSKSVGTGRGSDRPAAARERETSGRQTATAQWAYKLTHLRRSAQTFRGLNRRHDEDFGEAVQWSPCIGVLGIDEFEAKALKLGPQARARLAERLLDSLESLSDEENARIWAEEAERLAAAWDAKANPGRPRGGRVPRRQRTSLVNGRFLS